MNMLLKKKEITKEIQMANKNMKRLVKFSSSRKKGRKKKVKLEQ